MIRKIVSIILAISFIVLIITVIPMSRGGRHREQFGKQRSVSVQQNVSGERNTAAPRSEHSSFFPVKLHKIAGYIFIVFGLVHVFYNGRSLLSYIGIKRR